MKRRRIITTLILTLTLSLQTISVFAQPNKEVTNISSEKTDINNGWVHENNNWYYILNNKRITGWKEIDNNWYHFNSEGLMETGWKFINGYWYYLKSNGSMATGWQFINNDWYYLKSNGPMATSWQKINDDWYYLKPNGPMATGWQKINNNWYYLNSNGPMATGWRFLDNNWYHLSENGPMTIGWKNSDDKWYYLDNNGAMVQNSEKTVNGNIYKFDSDGVMITDKWFGSTYVNKDGIVLHGTPSRSHSYTQYKLFNYMSNEDNRESVHYAAIDLHGGETTNNCVYFTSEALRRAGVKIPLYVANTYQLERELLSRGWIKSTNTSDLRPGDVVFSGYKHSFTFMNWYDKDYAYIVDNQKKYFDSVLHKRLVSVDDPINDTIRATHFFYLPK
ncbi:cell wall-binding protein [Clostridium perfringens]|uniref:cell wall-binding protein n=1 Tax=Clostridium perfringens TaxID=1502 RepID=UPI0024686144|nr:cell wall-binding protein [Clostridium perfringens]MDH5087168.1 Toxin A [Clostridium perfringens]